MVVRTRTIRVIPLGRPGPDPLISHLSLLSRSRTSRLYGLLALIISIGSLLLAGGARAAVGDDPSYLVTIAAGTFPPDQAAALSAAGATDVSSIDARHLHTISALAPSADTGVAELDSQT